MNRINLINTIIKEHEFKTYLELGVYDSHTFRNIQCETKVSVDMNFPADYNMSTDKFFEINKSKFDIIFIDADHREQQATKDIYNSLEILNEGGVIICHDCNPPTEQDQIENNFLYQTVWKSFVKFRHSSTFLTYCIPDDCGLGVIDTSVQYSNIPQLPEGVDVHTIDYSDLEQFRNQLLNIKEE